MLLPDVKARHNMLSRDKKYVAYDVAPAKGGAAARGT